MISRAPLTFSVGAAVIAVVMWGAASFVFREEIAAARQETAAAKQETSTVSQQRDLFKLRYDLQIAATPAPLSARSPMTRRSRGTWATSVSPTHDHRRHQGPGLHALCAPAGGECSGADLRRIRDHQQPELRRFDGRGLCRYLGPRHDYPLNEGPCRGPPNRTSTR